MISKCIAHVKYFNTDYDCIMLTSHTLRHLSISYAIYHALAIIVTGPPSKKITMISKISLHSTYISIPASEI